VRCRRNGASHAVDPQVSGQFRVMIAVVEHRIALTLKTLGVFPMTSHVECLALLVRTSADLRRSDFAMKSLPSTEPS
jgi:hypothetical protein